MPDEFPVHRLQKTLLRQAAGLNPIFILGPTQSNGITLLQRLLNSSRQAIIFSENVHFMTDLPLMVQQVTEGYNRIKHFSAQALQQVLDGEFDTWLECFIPNPEEYILTTVESCYRQAMVYEHCCRQHGFQRWGVKYPLQEPATMDIFKTVFHRAQFVCIYRNLFDGAQSSKARKFISTPEEFQEYARRWNTHLLQFFKYADDGQVLLLKYEDFVGDSAAGIARLEEFLQLSPIDRTVMARKINIGDGKTGGYKTPQALTGQEIEILREYAAEGLKSGGYV